MMKNGGLDGVKPGSLDPIIQVPNLGACINTIVPILLETVQNLMLLLVCGHILFEGPVTRFTLIVETIQASLGLGSHMVNIIGT